MAKEALEVPEDTVEKNVKSIINDAIVSAEEGLGIEHIDKYKAMRALAYTAFLQAHEDGTLNSLVKATVKNADKYPYGWTPFKTTKAEEAKPVAKKAAAKPVAKNAPAGRTRPARRRPRAAE